MTWSNVSWHDSCFNCTQCNTSLLQWSSTLEKNNHPYCLKCYNQLFSPRCDKCGGIIESGMEYEDLNFINYNFMLKEHHG